MISISWRNLRKEKLRGAVAVLGVVFAVVLITVEVGMLLGLARNASNLIDGAKADIWVSSVSVKTFDFATPVSQRKKYMILSVPGVATVEEYNVSYSAWKLPEGGNANIQVVGFDLRGELAPTLNLVAGRVEDLHNQDAVIIDEGEREKLGYPELGDTVEIINQRAKVVGFTRNMKSFTTTPYVFTSLKRSRKYGWLTDDRMGGGVAPSIYFLVKVAPGQDVETVRAAINNKMADRGMEAHSASSFSWRTRRYWLFETGVGIGFMVAAFLGLLVGGVILSQTLYAMTVEKIREYGVLKAMGAGMRELSRIVVEQGLICGAIGLVLGLVISTILGSAATAAGTAVLLPLPLLAIVAVITVLLCVGASMVSILRLRRIEPAMVFRT